MKKRLMAGLLCGVVMALLTLPAMAHGCHGRGGHHGRQAETFVCPQAGCILEGRHTHDVQPYCGYHHSSGLCDGTCVGLCPVEGCEIGGRHVHDGVSYCGYGHGDGYCDGSCVGLCPVEGCEIGGRHVHDGVSYCGYGHGDGFCDGACQVFGRCKGWC